MSLGKCRRVIGKIVPALLGIILLARFVAGAPTPPPEDAKPAETTKFKDPLHRDTPQSSVLAFFQECRSRNYSAAAKYLDLEKLPQEQRLKNGPELAQQLQQLLDRDAQFDVANLSDQPEGSQSPGLPAGRERVDTFRVDHQNAELALERKRLRAGRQIWLFSPDTIQRVPQLAKLTSESAVERALPDPLVNWKIADTPLWKAIELALLAIVLAALSRLLSRGTILCTQPLLRRILPKLDRRVLGEFVGPLGLLLAVILFRAGMAWIGPSPKLHLYLTRGLSLVFFSAIFWITMAVVDISISRLRVVLRARHQTFYSVLPLASRITKLVILALVIVAVLGSWGYHTTTILAGLGVGGIAVALAAQKTLENLFGGLAVISDQPVVVGDYCKFGDKEGTVEDIGLRSTRVRAPDRTLVTVPNGQFSAMTIENISARDKLLFHSVLNLRRDTTAEQVRRLLDSISAILKLNPKLELGALPVRFAGFSKDSADLDISFFVLTRDGDEFGRIQHDLYLRILDAVAAAGTSVAVPQPVAPSNGDQAGHH